MALCFCDGVLCDSLPLLFLLPSSLLTNFENKTCPFESFPLDSQKSEGSSSNAQSSSSAPKPKKPVYSMKKGQIVRVDKEKYLNSINYLSVGHPP